MGTEINYPNQIKKTIATTTPNSPKRNYQKANLGANFENQINDSCAYYLQKGIASIYKKPTPIQIVKVDYPSRNKARIVEAYYKTPSTTDYNGIYKGYYIDFEAKCCHSTSFSFGHIYEHQIYHLDTIDQMGGIAFLIIEFPLKNEFYILPSALLKEKYLLSLQGGRKSISYEEFKKVGYLIKKGFQPTIDFLQVVDILIEKRTSKKGD
ncbi:MAG: Holliday junction resolvase RecU [Prevotella sp.]|nr:Holliday junction resolvase RecU [Staphylococcus sp.]MCM1350039.1 Holliday junction resolvase RecU [Prevotella sp.]